MTRGSVQADLAERQTGACVQAGRAPIGIQVFQGGDQVILAVQAGRVDAYWTAQPIAAHYAAQSGQKLIVAGEVPGAKSLTGIALPRGSELTEPVRAALQTLIDNGTYRAILTKWNLQSGAIARAETNPRPRS